MPRLGGGEPTSNSRGVGAAAGPGRPPAPNPGAPPVGDVVKDLSAQLDERLFEPLWASETERNTSEQLAARAIDWRSLAGIDEKLRTTKVYSAVLGLLCCAMSISSAMRGQPGAVLAYAVIAHDLGRISYNAYLKKYISNATRRLGDNVVSAAANTLLNMISSAILGKPDVVQRLQREVMWEALLDFTLAQRVMQLLPKASDHKVKHE